MALPCAKPPPERPPYDLLLSSLASRKLNGVLSAEPTGSQSTLNSFFVKAPSAAASSAASAAASAAASSAASAAASAAACAAAAGGGGDEVVDLTGDDPAPPPFASASAPGPLPPGVVLLKGFLSAAKCNQLIEATDGVAARKPFVIPEVPIPAGHGGGQPGFLHLYMSNAGWFWNGLKHIYERSADVPPVPPILLQRAREAVEQASTQYPFEMPPFASDRFTALFNVYPRGWGKIAKHADKDEREIRFPVVSFSIGDSVQFQLYPEGAPPLSVWLDSGDVLVFGGPSRLIPHSVNAPPQGVRKMGDLRLSAWGYARGAALPLALTPAHPAPFTPPTSVPSVRLNITLRTLPE